MVFQNSDEDVVVFFDFENIVYSLRNMLGENPNFELLMDKCQEYGRIVLARAYADWSRHNTVIAPLQASGFDPVYVPTYFYESKERKARKNAVDIHIAIEAVEVMFTQPHINTFILLTGDKDFIPLANALRRHGKTVIAVGVQGTTSPYMRQATDDFVFYHQLLDEPKGKKRKPGQKDIYKVLIDAVIKLQKEGQKTVFPQVKHTMTETLGSFNEKDYKDSKEVNFNRFKDFILEAQRLGHVQLVTTGSVNEVLLPGQTSPPPEIEELVEPEPAPLPPPEVTGAESAFDLLVWAVNHANQRGKSLRTSSIKTIMRSASKDFDEKQLENEDGEKFAKFSDFARAAARRGLVRIVGKGIRMEIHPNGGETPVPEVQTGPAMASVPEETQPPTQDDSVPIEPQLPVQDDPVPVEPQLPVQDDPVPVEPQPPVQSDPAPLEPQQTLESDLTPEEVHPIMQREPLPEEEPAPPVGQDDSSETTPDDLIAPPRDPADYVSDYRMRVLVVDALRSCKYPAPAYVIGQHCIGASEQRGVTLPNRRLNQLLTSARNIGLLTEASGEDAGTGEYTFVENPQQVKLFLEDES